ncbi:MAG: hypothetical protein ACE5EH_09730 [Gammaproteobacteria bacterium]
MSNISALNTGLKGIQRGQQKMNEAASKVANPETATSRDPVTVAEPLVDLMMARLETESAIKVVERVNETLGTVIDTEA